MADVKVNATALATANATIWQGDVRNLNGDSGAGESSLRSLYIYIHQRKRESAHRHSPDGAAASRKQGHYVISS
jgi:ABC-type dipeptide/oligopeptide/nickel transport system ATPase subunit